MSANLFHWGVIGPGKIAHKFAEGLQVVDDAVLYAVGSRSQERAVGFAEKYGASQSYGSYEALVSDPEVDGIYIATPHRFHHENALLCLDAGKPVLCEKPLTVNASQAKELIETARAKDLFLMEALWTRFLPIYRCVREWLDAGAIGEVRLLVSTFCFQPPRDPEHRTLNHELAGGALLDIGVYNVAISQWVYGVSPQSFTVQGYLGETNVDELLAVSMRYGEIATSQFTCGFVVKAVNDFYIYGTEGHIRIHPMFWGATQATLVTQERELTVTEPFRANGFEYQTEEAMRCIRDGEFESPIMPHAHTLSNMELMDGIRAEIGLRYSFE